MLIILLAELSNTWIYPLIVGTIVSIIFGITGWSLGRNIAAQDTKIDTNASRHEKQIKEQEAIIFRIQEELNKFKEKTAENNSTTHAKISDMTEKILRDINELAIKIAEMKRNDLTK